MEDMEIHSDKYAIEDLIWPEMTEKLRTLLRDMVFNYSVRVADKDFFVHEIPQGMDM